MVCVKAFKEPPVQLSEEASSHSEGQSQGKCLTEDDVVSGEGTERKAKTEKVSFQYVNFKAEESLHLSESEILLLHGMLHIQTKFNRCNTIASVPTCYNGAVIFQVSNALSSEQQLALAQEMFDLTETKVIYDPSLDTKVPSPASYSLFQRLCQHPSPELLNASSSTPSY